MTEFTVRVLEEDEDGVFIDRILSKTLEWPHLPRQGDLLFMAGTDYEVTGVRHHILAEKPVIDVDVSAQGFDFTNLIDEAQWQKSW